MSTDTLVSDLVESIQEAIDSRLGNLHTAMPGIVQKYDAAKQKADVQPVLKRKYADGKVEQLPVLVNVPVLMPRTGKAFISLPLAKDDIVLLVFAERSLDKWLAKGGIIDPEEPRKHHLSDAIAIPGVYPFSKAFKGDSKNLVLVNDKARLELHPTGKITFGNGAQELLSLFDQFIDAVMAATTATSIGPQPLVSTDFALIKTKLATILSEE